MARKRKSKVTELRTSNEEARNESISEDFIPTIEDDTYKSMWDNSETLIKINGEPRHSTYGLG
jgi:hypothetical protein